MAVKKSNKRITITISKNQFNWLVNQSKKKDMTISHLISYLLVAKCNEIKEYLDLNVNSFDDIKRIANTPWLDD